MFVELGKEESRNPAFFGETTIESANVMVFVTPKESDVKDLLKHTLYNNTTQHWDAVKDQMPSASNLHPSKNDIFDVFDTNLDIQSLFRTKRSSTGSRFYGKTRIIKPDVFIVISGEELNKFKDNFNISDLNVFKPHVHIVNLN